MASEIPTRIDTTDSEIVANTHAEFGKVLSYRQFYLTAICRNKIVISYENLLISIPITDISRERLKLGSSFVSI